MKIGHSDAETLLQSNRRGVLAMNGDNGTLMLFRLIIFMIVIRRKFIFHGAKAGHKVEALKTSDKVCFTVYGNERIDESESWAPYVQSAVVFGRCRLLEAGPESIAR